jgi:hypothetical protein
MTRTSSFSVTPTALAVLPIPWRVRCEPTDLHGSLQLLLPGEVLAAELGGDAFKVHGRGHRTSRSRRR